jgi:tRNA (cmo5U34)-methyltransferase
VTQDLSYDQLVQRLIPGYTSLARLAVTLLAASPLASREGSRVLVAGCGTGAELLEARAQRPDWRLTAVDPSEAMLAVAKDRLGEAANIDWRRSTVEDLAAEELFDGALAVLVLQSLPDDGGKLTFLTALARSLRAGGQLILVDLMQPERSPLQAQVDAAWQSFQRASAPAVPSESMASLSQGLHPIGAARLAALVNAAGFSDPALVFKALDFEGVLVQRQA